MFILREWKGRGQSLRSRATSRYYLEHVRHLSEVMNVRVGRKEIVHNSAEQAQNIHKEYTKQVLKALRRSSRTSDTHFV